MVHDIKFLIDDYDRWLAYYTRKVKVNRRNKEMLLHGYTDTVYSWELCKYEGPLIDSFWQQQASAPDQEAGAISANYLLEKLNTDYCFDFDYEPKFEDRLSVFFGYRNPAITGISRPPLYKHKHDIIVRFNGTEWDEDFHRYDMYKQIYRGIVEVTEKK